MHARPSAAAKVEVEIQSWGVLGATESDSDGYPL